MLSNFPEEIMRWNNTIKISTVWLLPFLLCGAGINTNLKDDGAVCVNWPAADREGMRFLIDHIPLRESFCDKSLAAFWANCQCARRSAPPDCPDAARPQS
jgi:hypothetical protein